MLTKDETTLLENVLESLNRLFDRESTVTDVHALLVATAIAFRVSELAEAFEVPIRQLRDLVDSNAPPDPTRDQGLDATDGLRKLIAEQLRRDTTENPKRRHVPGPGVARDDAPAG